ncbi:helix-turn-helix domain-containing protein [Allopusillimonas ginsengisoli]|uniref:helix-turn-helix domain-containing protein n=1 Tax=Allopusillimonas ginsengisoli TaxID=453575 RepID=UPI0039C291C6
MCPGLPVWLHGGLKPTTCGCCALLSKRKMHPKEPNTSDSVSSSPKDDVMLARLARNCIEKRYCKLHSLSDLASVLGTDCAHLGDVLQRVFGTDFSYLLAQARFLAAQRLLVQSSLSLNEIAAQVGFEHTADFVSAFHEHVGINPWSFRGSPYKDIIQIIQS